MDITYYKKYEPIFGSWKIVREIGEGSFGKVFEIEREDFGYTYKSALKAITIPQSESELESILDAGMDIGSAATYCQGIVKELNEEFRLMSKLKGNSNVVSYEDHVVNEHTDGIGWDILIRMELLTPLMKYIRSNPLNRDGIIQMGIDICKALELCRKHDIVHRDIKPDNIFVSDDGLFKLGDFGIAKTMEHTTGSIGKKGTYNYMAPEVYKGEPYGSRVDIYSLGIMLYRFLNGGRLPFQPPAPAPLKPSDNERAISRRISGEPMPAPINADAELAKVILKACAYNPKERYSSPTEMREALEAVAAKRVSAPMAEEPAVTDEDDDKTVGVFSTAKPAVTEDTPEAAVTEEPAVTEVFEPSDAETVIERPLDEEDKTVGVFSSVKLTVEEESKVAEPSLSGAETVKETPVLPEEDTPEDNGDKTEVIFDNSPNTEEIIASPVKDTENEKREEKVPPKEDKAASAPKKKRKKGLILAAILAAVAIAAIVLNMSRQSGVYGWTDIVAVSAGSRHTVGLRSDGTVLAVGLNDCGQCDVGGWTDIIAVSAGDSHTVGLRSDGTVVAVGNNECGQCGVYGWTDIIAVCTGDNHTIGLRSDGTVVATGNNYDGPKDIAAISEGFWHTVVLCSDGTVDAAGVNDCGQCDVHSWTDIVAVSAGDSHTVGLRSDGTVLAVGLNDCGQCDVGGWTDIAAVSAGGWHTVGLRSDGTVVAVGDSDCWK